MTTSDITPGEQVRIERAKDGTVYAWEGALLEHWPTTDGEGVLVRTGSGDECLAVSERPDIATTIRRITEQ